MIIDDDGYGQVGGNGSVEWVIDIGNLIGHSMQGKGPKGKGPKHFTRVVAENGKNRTFTVSVKLPEGRLDAKRLKAALSGARLVGNRLEFTLPIEKDTENQINISWGLAGAKLKKRLRQASRRARLERRLARLS